MDPNVNAALEFLFRWIHVVAGIAWIGHLSFFNFVNAQVAKTYVKAVQGRETGQTLSVK